MSTTTRLLAFAAGLVLVFAATFAAGDAFGPEPESERDAPTDHTNHPEPSE